MSSSALFVHVPVSRMEIVSARVNGGKLFYFMGLNDPEKQMSITVTLRTAASDELFQRKLVLSSIPRGGTLRRLKYYDFEGSFANQSVLGTFYVAKNGKVTGELLAA